MGIILDAAEARDWLKSSVAASKDPIDLCSAYLKLAAIEYLFNSFIESAHESNIRVLTRWKPRDLLSGASDIDVYKFCEDRRIPFHIREDFHGKVYQVKPAGVLVGSSNLTRSGFQIGIGGNEEASVVVPCGSECQAYVESLFEGSTTVDDSLFIKISSWVENNKETHGNVAESWPGDWLQVDAAQMRTEKLLVDECFHFDWGPTLHSMDLSHDLSLLGGSGLEIVVSQELKKSFRSSRMYLWFKNILKLRAGEIYFGDLSSSLHDALVDDPRPFRKDVKILVKNLLIWIVKLEIQEVIVDRPKHSQRIRINH